MLCRIRRSDSVEIASSGRRRVVESSKPVLSDDLPNPDRDVCLDSSAARPQAGMVSGMVPQYGDINKFVKIAIKKQELG